MSKWDPGFFLFFAQVVGLDTARIKTFPSRVLKKLLKILDKEVDETVVLDRSVCQCYMTENERN